MRHAVSKLQELLGLNRAADMVSEEGVTAKLLNFAGLETLHKMYNNLTLRAPAFNKGVLTLTLPTSRVSASRKAFLGGQNGIITLFLIPF